MVPLVVALTTPSIKALVPPANFSNSKTPAGLLNKIKQYYIFHEVNLVYIQQKLLKYIPIPYNNFSSRDGIGEDFPRFRSNIETHPALRNTTGNISSPNLKTVNRHSNLFYSVNKRRQMAPRAARNIGRHPCTLLGIAHTISLYYNELNGGMRWCSSKE